MVEQTAKAEVRVVDDTADHRKVFGILLESDGYFVTECSSGIEALTALEAINVDRSEHARRRWVLTDPNEVVIHMAHV
jgi:CheY-like chemotaxis protein